MAGIKGRSGGKRAGAGRKPKPPVASGIQDPLDFLKKVWAGEVDASPTQVRAAAAALPFLHAKKEAAKGKGGAEKPAVPSKYAPRTAPRLVAAGGKGL